LIANHFGKDHRPRLLTRDIIDRVKQDTSLEEEQRDSAIRYLKRATAKEIFLDNLRNGGGIYSELEVVNLWINQCYSCKRMAVWHADNLIYPTQKFAAEPNEDMPADVRLDFLEAGLIVDASARGAAALLRLAIQKLMAHLGEKGKNINDDIGALVSKGLDAKAQKALDAVRVIGNNAVHPGTIDLKDDKATAIKLFDLVNFIVQTQISDPKKIDEIYGKLSPKAVDAIEKRDGVAQIAPPATSAT
jgi:hypothetical protein